MPLSPKKKIELDSIMKIEIKGKYQLICMGLSAQTTPGPSQRASRLKSMISLLTGCSQVWIVDQRFKASQTLGFGTRFWGFSNRNLLDAHRGAVMRLLLGWWATVWDILGRRSRWGYIASSLPFSLAKTRHEAGKDNGKRILVERARGGENLYEWSLLECSAYIEKKHDF